MAPLNVLSLFDGISCGQIALNRAGIAYDSYHAAEIEPAAIAVTQHNYPKTIQLGDVTKVSGGTLPTIDLLIGGSPCQGFSFAGKKLNFDDPRSKLFFEYVRLRNELKPRWFLLENVLMKEEHIKVITEQMGVEPVMIDSAGFSAQSRKRLYWTNIPLAAAARTGSGQNLMVTDILEPTVPDRFLLTSSYNLMLKKDPTVSRLDVLKREYREEHAKGLMKPVLVSEVTHDTPSTRSRQTDRLYSALSKSPTLLANRASDLKVDVGSPDQTKWRTLTPLECERLQTVPEGYTACVKDPHRFRALGNGWTVDVIAHVLRGMVT